MTTDERLDAIRVALGERLEAANAAARAAADAVRAQAGAARDGALLGTYLARLETARELTNVARALDLLRGDGGTP